ncbi:MAG TPA: glutathione S-transferase domain-containing protein, partial [Thermoplasmata archaeon]|nr:glutathione S-transferase domain-containing protein [Thermoplasmata archaeon]
LEMRREEFRQDMLKEFARIEAILDGRDWLLGKPSLADFGVYGSISPLFIIGEHVPKEFPQLTAWAKRIQVLKD